MPDKLTAGGDRPWISPIRPEHAAFRREFRAWLDANLTDDLKVEDAQDQRVSPDRETLERRRAWQKKMHAAGWIGIVLAEGVWRPRRQLHAAGDLRRGVFPRPRADPARHGRHEPAWARR